MKYVFIFFVIFVLFYFTNSKCIETFSNLENSDDNDFIEIGVCDDKRQTYRENCAKYYVRDGSNDSNEPDYYGCIKGDHNNCSKSSRCIDSGKCPSCGNLSKYTLMGSDGYGAGICTSNLDTCKKCLNSENEVSFSASGENGDYYIRAPYTEICPKDESDLTYTECDESNEKCKSDLNNILKDTMNSSGNCSIQSLYTKLKNASGERSINCNGNIHISGQEEWLDEKLATIGGGYCKPINASWTCNRDIPSFCEHYECELSGDIDNKKCDCKSPNKLLQNNTCGKPDCNHIAGGLCKKGFSCSPSIWGGIRTYSCVKVQE